MHTGVDLGTLGCSLGMAIMSPTKEVQKLEIFLRKWVCFCNAHLLDICAQALCVCECVCGCESNFMGLVTERCLKMCRNSLSFCKFIVLWFICFTVELILNVWLIDCKIMISC